MARASRPGWDHGRPSGLDAGLEETYYYEPPTVTWTSAVHLAVVDVDIETGRVTVERYVVAHDCGVVVNPMLVEGQIIGGAAQGLGGILLEEFTYDSEGQLLTGSLMDYLLPTAYLSYSFISHNFLSAGAQLQFQSPARCWKLTFSTSYDINTVDQKSTSTFNGFNFNFDLALNISGTGFGGVSEMANTATAPK